MGELTYGGTDKVIAATGIYSFCISCSPSAAVIDAQGYFSIYMWKFSARVRRLPAWEMNTHLSILTVMLQTNWLKLSRKEDRDRNLAEEHRTFRIRPRQRIKEIPAWRENVHNDLVFAVALAC